MKHTDDVFCHTCHGQVGHRINCPHGIAFSGQRGEANMMHTKEPWTITEYTKQSLGGPMTYSVIEASAGWAEGGRTIAEVGHWNDRPNGTEDAERIVACVNTLAGMNPEAVGEVVENYQWLFRVVGALLDEQMCQRAAGEAVVHYRYLTKEKYEEARTALAALDEERA